MISWIFTNEIKAYSPQAQLTFSSRFYTSVTLSGCKRLQGIGPTPLTACYKVSTVTLGPYNGLLIRGMTVRAMTKELTSVCPL